MSDTQPKSYPSTSRVFRGRLARRMVAILLPAVLVPVLVIGLVLTYKAQGYLQQQLAEQLHQAESEMRGEINDQLLAKSARIDAILHRHKFIAAAHQLLTRGHYEPRFAAAQQEVLSDLEDINRYETYPLFNDFFILDTDFAILASSNPAWVGLQVKESPLAKVIARLSGRSLQGMGGIEWMGAIAPTTEAFAPDVFGGVHFPIYNYSPLPSERQRTFLFTVLSYKDALSGKSMYIVGVSEELAMERLLRGLARRYPGSRAFLLLYDGTYLTIDPVTNALTAYPAPSVFQTQGFRSANAAVDSEYTSPIEGQKVFAAAQWVPMLNAAIGMELPRTLLTRRSHELTPYALQSLLLLVVLLVAVVWGVATYITRPILRIAEVARRFAEGDWLMRAPVERGDEIGLLAHSFNYMADQLSDFYRSLEAQVEERTAQVQTAAEVAALATSAVDLREILRRSVALIVERFPQYYQASVFLLDESGYAVLEESTGPAGEEMKRRGHRLEVGGNSIVGWVAAHGQPRVASDVSEEVVHFKNPLLPETRSEAGIPLIVGNQVLGVLDVQSKSPDAFDEYSVETLQALASQLAAAIYNARLREQAEAGRGEAEVLYRIVGELAKAEKESQIVEIGAKAVTQLPFIGAMFVRQPLTDEMVLRAAHHPQKGFLTPNVDTLGLASSELRRYLPRNMPLLIHDAERGGTVPGALLRAAKALGCRSVVFLPVYNGDVLAATFMVGDEQPNALSVSRVETYVTLADVAGAALERVGALEEAGQRLQEFRMLVDLGQSIAEATTPEAFYEVLRAQIAEMFGDIGLVVALYDPLRRMITVPYAYEQGGNVLQIEPFPLGEGLISHVINTRRPLLIAENMEAQAKALGAKIVGKPANSWLGVPLMVGERLMGVLVLQHTEREHAFSERDLDFVEAIATLVALLLSKVRMMTQMETAHRREQTLFGIVQHAQQTDDVEQILSYALGQLTRVLNARRGAVRLRLDRLQEMENGTS